MKIIQKSLFTNWHAFSAHKIWEDSAPDAAVRIPSESRIAELSYHREYSDV